jgi:hypothetical protein
LKALSQANQLFLQHEVAEKRLIDIFTQALLYLAKPTQLGDLFCLCRAWLRYAFETIIGLAKRGKDDRNYGRNYDFFLQFLGKGCIFICTTNCTNNCINFKKGEMYIEK